MKITGISVRLIEIDPAPRYRDGRIPPGRPLKWRYPLLTVHTDGGVDGHSMAYGPHGDGVALADTLKQVYEPLILGEDPMHPERIWRKLAAKQRHLYNQSASLLGVVDVAIWDIKGRILGRSIGDLLGRCHDRLACYASSRSEEFAAEEIFEEARRMKAAGFHGYKVQFRAGPGKDIPRLRAAREAVGDGFALMQDPNAGYTFDEALQVGRVLDELDYLWYEEPIPDQHLMLLRRLQSQLRTPLLVGETSRFEETHQFLNEGAFSLVRADVLIKGGISGLRKILSAAELFGVRVELHTTNTPLLDVAQLHVGCGSVTCRLIENHHPVFRFGLIDNPMEPDGDGFVYPPAGPGLGVALDWNWIDRHSLAG
jgi:L-alanine-DL-glutamate epimerase-like enolase superfamily enzyme